MSIAGKLNEVAFENQYAGVDVTIKEAPARQNGTESALLTSKNLQRTLEECLLLEKNKADGEDVDEKIIQAAHFSDELWVKIAELTSYLSPAPGGEHFASFSEEDIPKPALTKISRDCYRMYLPPLRSIQYGGKNKGISKAVTTLVGNCIHSYEQATGLLLRPEFDYARITFTSYVKEYSASVADPGNIDRKAIVDAIQGKLIANDTMMNIEELSRCRVSEDGREYTEVLIEKVPF